MSTSNTKNLKAFAHTPFFSKGVTPKGGGFTLIELLVVVAIISLLSSVVLSSLNSAREKGRDAKRLSDLKQIRTALELYFDDNGTYPQRGLGFTYDIPCSTSDSSGTDNWCNLVTDLAPYLSEISGDPLGAQNVYVYAYDSDSGDNYQTYGMFIRLESSSNFDKAIDDGGWWKWSTADRPYYEVGQQPRYCMNKYSDNGRKWHAGDTVCKGGN